MKRRGITPPETLEEDLIVSTLSLKCLKRGPPPSQRPPCAYPYTPGDAALCSALDDDIEFSSQEDHVARGGGCGCPQGCCPWLCSFCKLDEHSSRHISTACSSSKFSLHGQRILATFSARKLKAPKITPNPKATILTSVEASSNKKVFPRLTTSPLKRIQLLDSDSDDLSIGEDRCKDVKGVDSCLKTKISAPTQSLSKSQQQKPEMTSVKLQSENLWKDFGPMTNVKLATPALNEFCEEYYKSVKSPNAGQCSNWHTTATNSDVLPDYLVDGAECHRQNSCINNSTEQYWNLSDLQPPSYQYYYHHDVKIQKLVQQCLPNFVPLGDMKYARNQQQSAETLDYMSQFGQRKAPHKVHQVGENAHGGGSKDRPRNRKNAKGKEVTEAPGTWVTPKTCTAIPKDAGKRRVHADSHSSGHWYTGQDGKKVYVTKDGQELSGRIAYIHYVKESGVGFQRKSKKKAAGASKKKAKR